MLDIVVYSSAWCPYCTRAKALLDSKGARYREILVDGLPDNLREMHLRSGRRSVPQIFIGEHHVGGCDDLYALERSCALDPLLAGA